MGKRGRFRFIKAIIDRRHSALIVPATSKKEDNSKRLVEEALKNGHPVKKCPPGKGGGLGRRANYRNVHSGRLAGKT